MKIATANKIIQNKTEIALKNIGVDLTHVLPGADNGGAKTFSLALLLELCKQQKATNFIVYIKPEMEVEIRKIKNRPKNLKHITVPSKFEEVGSLKKVSKVVNSYFPERMRKFSRSFFRKIVGLVNVSSDLESHSSIDLMFYPFSRPDLNYSKSVPSVSVIYDLQHKFFPQNFDHEEIKQRDYTLELIEKRSDKVICISEFSLATVKQHTNIEPSRLKCVHIKMSGRLSGGSIAAGRRFKHVLGSKYFIFPANFWPHKNHDLLIAAFLIARNKGLDPEIKLVLSGSLIGREKYFEALLTGLGLSDNVILIGFVDKDVFSMLFKNAHALVYPSFFEGFGMPVLEAMSLGVPVLCSEVSSLPEVAKDAALYFDARKPQDIAAAMVKITVDEGFRRQLIAKGIANSAKFSKTNEMAKEYWETFESCLR